MGAWLSELNPADVVHHLAPQQPGKAIRVQHQPAMPWRNIPKFVAEHLGRRVRHDQSRAMLELLILTACRSGELRGMTWDEIDFDKAIWTIPAARMKAKMPHRVPLTPRALKFFADRMAITRVSYSQLPMPKARCPIWC